MPFYGEVDLHGYVWQCDGLSELKAVGVTRDLLSALQHIHSCGIIHRDVKPENMILGHDGRAVLLDFDVACDASDRVAIAAASGSPGYIAPEVLLGRPCSFSADIFSVGSVVYFMFAKVHPFLKKKGATLDDVVDHTTKCNVTFGRRFSNVSRKCLEFVVSILERDPKRRLSEEQASAHPWLLDKETAECPEGVPETSVPETGAEMLFEKVDSLPMEHTDSTSSKDSRVSRAKLAGRNMMGKLSRAVGKMRGKSTTVSRLDSKRGNRTMDVLDSDSWLALKP
eukprot:TRINITY_DN13805_c1_g2_i1.p1 TRINITY_DN13805_c1_g2~~TRINITY_DN13805_c1_g2_i1.p1  ORF type:complete len:282 (+),score=56.96 TRINITY_DN13805_c1_g2_i1:313-1158(+)